MKRIQSKSIEMSDFKGQTRRVELNENSTTITGANGVGKTTVMKALMWLLTGRTDAVGKINSELFDNRMELTPDTPEAIVRAVIAIDGVEHTLTRSAKAKFKRPKGQTEFVKADSDDYKYTIDGMNYTATDFNGWIEAQIAPAALLPIMLLGETFAILAENDRVKARKVLTDIIGEKTPDLGEFEAVRADIESGERVEVLQDRCRQTIKECNDKLNAIPEQLSVHRMNREALKNQVENFNTDYEAQKKELESKIEAVKQTIADKNNSVAEQNKEYQRLLMRKNELQAKIADAEAMLKKSADEKDNAVEELEKEKSFLANGVMVCDKCGSKIQIDEQTTGESKKRINLLESVIADYNDNAPRRQSDIVGMKSELEGIVLPELVAAPDLSAEMSELDKFNAQLTDIIANIRLQEAKKNELAACEAAINALQEQQRTYGQNLADAEVKKMQLDKYQQRCAELLSNEVNSLMSDTKIQMFELQKNGEQKPSCTITNKDGVKYSTLNFSARILANIEISRLFCRLLDVNVPCFVDECSVFDSAHMPDISDTQMVYIRCSDDKELTVL